MGLYDSLAGGLDHFAGSTDEWVGRQTNANGPDAQYAGDHFLGSTDEWFARSPLGGPVDYAKDLVGSGHADDTVDVWGPTLFGTEGSLTDALVSEQGETTTGDTRTQLLIGGFVALVVLYLVRPLLEIGAEVTDEG